MDSILNRKENESAIDYLYRLGSMKEMGFIKSTWMDLSEILNYCISKDKPRTETYWRKAFKDIKETRGPWVPKEPLQPDPTTPAEFLAALKGERVLIHNERLAAAKQIRDTSRVEHLLATFKEEINAYAAPPEPRVFPEEHGTRHIVAMLGDIHYGATFDNSAGTYNTDIARARLLKYANKLVQIAGDNADIKVILMGDLISGRIHKSVQIENSENAVKQVVGVSELISEFLYTVAKAYRQVDVHSISGNHSRIEDEALVSPRGEKLDALVPWYCQSKLSNITNVTFYSNMDDSISTFTLEDLQFVAVHGDYDKNIGTSAHHISALIRKPIDIMLSAHMHVPAYQIDDIMYFRNGSVCGSGDEYTVKRRLFAPPTQIALVFDGNKLDGIIPVRLN